MLRNRKTKDRSESGPSLRENLTGLLKIMQNDPTISDELPIAKKLIAKSMRWLVLNEFFLVLQLYPVKFFIDEINHDAPNVTKLLLISFSFGVIHKISDVVNKQMALSRNTTMWRLWRIWWGYGHRVLLRLSTDWHTLNGTGEKESLVSKNILKFENMIDELMFNTIPAALRITFTTLFLLTVGWVYAILSLATMVTYALMVRKTEGVLEPLRKKSRKRMKAIERFGSELNKNWRTIKEIGREEDFSDQNDSLLLGFCEFEEKRHKTAMGQFMHQSDVVSASRMLLYALFSLSILWQQPQLGLIVLAGEWMGRSYSNFGRFADFQQRMSEGLESMRELVALMCLPPTVQQPATPIWPSQITGRVEFRDVDFRYPDATECALTGVSFVAEPYTATALVGSSGCGKSTLMGLLQRLHDPTGGYVLVDGVGLSELDYNRYRREAISVVSQDVQLFDGTIMHNIRVSKPDATDEDVIEAARLAYADEFIVKQPNGYHTEVGENGIRLSGGQKQRIAIARALLRKPAILILDEATSALDAISQQRVQESINDLIERREVTIFIIAHRFSTIESADQVVVLDDGRLAEIGTHAELQRHNGLYARLRAMETKGLLD